MVTLIILLLVIFLIGTILPGDITGKLVPRGTPAQLEAKRIEIGYYDPWYEKLGRLFKSVVTGDFGDSFRRSGTKVTDLVNPAAGRSAILVGFALLVFIPISIIGGLIAARKKDSLLDRAIVTLGLASASIPDFVTAIFLQYFLGIKLGWFEPIAALPSSESGIVRTLWRLVLPVMTLLIVYFGYIARITRAGAIETFDSDYTRTAYMKGLTNRDVVKDHVLRNALQPTVAVVGTQIGFMFGGLVALEFVFGYRGLGSVILGAASPIDPPVLQASIVLVAIVFMAATFLADVLIAWMNPRARLRTGD